LEAWGWPTSILTLEIRASYLTLGWVWPSAGVWVWIWWQAVLSLVGIGFVMKAYLIGEVTYVSVFEHSMIIFASITAWVFFGDSLSASGYLGIGLIIVTGTIISIRSKTNACCTAITAPN